jgi:hypothetical protein
MDSIKRLKIRPDDEVAVYYLWDLKSPLKEYLRYKWNNDTTTQYFKQWASMGPLYAGYGKHLILNHPISFAQYYLWPNFVKYFAPPSGFMGMYNVGRNTVDSTAMDWFHWKNAKLPFRAKNHVIVVAEDFAVISAVINVIFALSCISFIILYKNNRTKDSFKQLLSWALAFWFCNLAFSVFSAPIELRYQLFPTVLAFVFATMLVTAIWEATRLSADTNQ